MELIDGPTLRWLMAEPRGARAIVATVAAEIGLDNLRALLREFYQLHAEELVTTEQLE